MLLDVCKIYISFLIITLMMQNTALTFLFLCKRTKAILPPPLFLSLSLFPFQILLMVRSHGPSLPWLQAITVYKTFYWKSRRCKDSYIIWAKVAQPCIPSPQEAETGRSRVDARLGYISGHLKKEKKLKMYKPQSLSLGWYNWSMKPNHLYFKYKSMGLGKWLSQ